MAVNVGDQKPRLRNLQPDGKGVDQWRRRVVRWARDHDVGMRSDLQAVRRIAGGIRPPGAVADTGGRMRQRR
jgi:hypothetical protein